MAQHMHEHHGHAHSHAPARFDRAFAIGIALNLGFVVAEAGFGFYANSLALLADAGHNLSDVLGLVLAWAAAWASRRPPTRTFTYGLRRTSILASLGNAALLLIAVGAIAAQAVERLTQPAAIAPATVMIVAAVGIVVNGATAWLLRGGQHDLNVRGAFLHMVADAAISAGVVVAALAIAVTGWHWIDAAASLAIAAVIALGTWRLLREAARLSLDAVPASVDPQAVERFLQTLPGVAEVHHVHIWATSTTEIALTAHLVRPGAALDDAFLDEAARQLASRFGIGHATLQVETGACAARC